MDKFLIRSCLDIRFVDLAIFMCIGIWPWLLISTVGTAMFAWKFVLLCQLIAMPFAFVGWAVGFPAGRRFGVSRQGSAMLAGWVALLTAEAGLAFVGWLWWAPSGFGMAGLWAFPGLAVLVTVGVRWFYRAETWTEKAWPQ